MRKNDINENKNIFYFFCGMTVMFFVMIVTAALIKENKINQSNIHIYDTCLALQKLSKLSDGTHASTNAKVTPKAPKVYKLAEVRSGALSNRTSFGTITDKTTMHGEEFEKAVQIVFESIKIHTYPDEREWFNMCQRIYQGFDKAFGGRWSCIASDKPINSFVRFSGSYLNIKLDDLYFEIYRSR